MLMQMRVLGPQYLHMQETGHSTPNQCERKFHCTCLQHHLQASSGNLQGVEIKDSLGYVKRPHKY